MPKGVYERQPGYRPRKKDDPDLVSLVRRLYEAGKTQAEVGEAIGRSRKFVQGVFRRNGIAARKAIKRNQNGEHNSAWKGSAAGYQALHLRVYSMRGTPSECSRCGATSPDKTYDWANLTGRYDDIEDYERM